MPAFEGRTLEGDHLSVSSLIGKRLLLFVFNPELPESQVAAQAVAAVAAERAAHNFSVVGIAVGSSFDVAREFVEKTGLDFPVLDDSSARIARTLGLRLPLVLLGVDPEGYLLFGMGSFATDIPDAAAVLESQVRERLRMPERGVALSGDLDPRPPAPDFEGPVLDGDEPFRLADHKGEPVVLVFFLHTCPHCHEALRDIEEILEGLPEKTRPLVVGISIEDKPTAVRALMREKGLDYFPIVFDPGQKARTAYGVFGGVPDIVLIGADGRIGHRVTGWAERDPALLRMHLAKLGGAPVPMLLNPKGYTGSDVCGVCHTLEHATWEFTSHAAAFNTLVKHAADTDGECVSCHVVGFEKPGGFSMADRPAHLEDVGCESCHGRGGPHLTPGFVQNGSYDAVCQTCHNPTHSLGFEYASFRPKISHTGIASMTAAEREALLAGRGKPRDLLPTGAIVGSEACQTCHPAEFATWAGGAHARAVESLAAVQEQKNDECMRCHTTGFGRSGGFPPAAAPADHSDLARVGCESCHGPGGDHVAEGAAKLGTIVSLGDKCDSCVILQICGSCHDDANDPGFRFDVKERIEAQRHGTIAPGTGKPLGASAHRTGARAEEWVAEAFRVIDERARRPARESASAQRAHPRLRLEWGERSSGG
ncbi:MAG: redoxin domain-containing protein [Proteobacteria bacterium]|nr:redoxin domain-containing protein [Pseudomonadota bacterium]